MHIKVKLIRRAQGIKETHPVRLVLFRRLFCSCSLFLTSGFLTRISNNSFEISKNLPAKKEGLEVVLIGKIKCKTFKIILWEKENIFCKKKSPVTVLLSVSCRNLDFPFPKNGIFAKFHARMEQTQVISPLN